MKKNWKETLKLWLGALLIPFAVVAEAVSTGCKKLGTLPKKVMALCVAAAMVLSLLPLSAFAEETDEARWVVQTGTDLPDTFTDSGTLEEAMDVANNADSNMYTYIQLCRDVIVNTTDYALFYLDYLQHAVLDLGGYTLSAVGNGYAYAVMNSGTLLVRNGTVSASGSNTCAIYSDGNTILESGTFTATRTWGTYPYYAGFGIRHEGGEIYLGDVTKIEGTDADIFLTDSDSLFANDGAATPTYYNGSALTVASVEPAMPEYSNPAYPHILHEEVLISGLNDTNKDKFILVDGDAEYFQTRYDEANSCLTMEGKPMSVTWYDEYGTVLTGNDYPTSVPFSVVIETLPTPTKEGKEFVGWAYRSADSDYWYSQYTNDCLPVITPIEAKAVYLYELTPVTDDTGTYIPISSAEDLMALSAIINSRYKRDEYNVNSVTYRLMNDIDMSQVCGENIGSFMTIGHSASYFNANFDGNGKTISNLYVAQTDDAALFYRLGTGVTVKDLTVSGDFISAGSAYALFAYASNNLTLSNCTLLGTVSGRVGDASVYGRCYGSTNFNNVDTSGVVILPPKNYTVTPGGYMAYGPTLYDTFDVVGSYNGQLIPTTYANHGYEYMAKDMDGATVSVSGSSLGGGRYVKMTYTVTAGDTAVTAGKLAVHADVQVGSNDSATVRVIKSGDKVIGISLLDENEYSDTFGAQFSLYFADSAGVTNADSYWFGYYSDRDIHAFETLNSETASDSDYEDDYSALYNEDSGFAISWQNIALNPGESKSYSLTLGVGEAVDPIVWGNPDVTLSSTTTDDAGRVNVTAKVKDEAGLKDTLFASVDNGEEMQLTTVTAVDGETSATAVLDLSDYAPGEHQVTFWFVNEEGSMTTVVTKTVTVTAPVAGKFQDATPSTNVGAAKPNASAVELEAAVPLTDSEKQAKDKGEDVLTWLEVRDATSTVSTASKEAIAKALGSNKKVGMYLDLAMFKKVGDAEAQALTQLNEKITIIMKVPTELLPESEAQGRVYYIVRTHNGTVDLLDTKFDAEVGTITFETDRFSDYAIAYSDIEPSPATGDSFSTVLWVTLMAVSAMALAVLLIGKKKEIF